MWNYKTLKTHIIQRNVTSPVVFREITPYYQRLHTRNRHLGNNLGLSVALFKMDFQWHSFSDIVSLFSGIFQRIVTCPVIFALRYIIVTFSQYISDVRSDIYIYIYIYISYSSDFRYIVRFRYICQIMCV